MQRTNTHIDTSTRSWFPSWYFHSILESGVQYIDWTSPWMCMLELCIVRLCPAPNFNGAQTISSSRSVIMQVNRIGHGQRPQRFVKAVRPLQCSMEHKNSGSSSYIFDGIFSCTILMMCTNSTEPQSLLILLKF